MVDDTIRISFDHAEGLTTLHTAPLIGFVAHLSDGRLVKPKAEIINEEVTLSLPVRDTVCAISYEMTASAFPVLTNASGRPASPFLAQISECRSMSTNMP